MGKRVRKEKIIIKGVSLRPREREILPLIADGLTNGAIANRMVIQEKSVQAILTSLYRKLGVEGRAQAISWHLDAEHQMKMKEQEEHLIDRILQDRNQLMKDLSAAAEVRRREISEPRKPSVKKPDPPAIRFLKAIREPFIKDVRKESLGNELGMIFEADVQRMKRGEDLGIMRQGFTDEEYATLVVLQRLNLLVPTFLEKMGLAHKIRIEHVMLNGSDGPDRILRRKYYDINRNGFTVDEYCELWIMAEANLINPDYLTRRGLAEIVEVVHGEGAPKLIRRRDSTGALVGTRYQPTHDYEDEENEDIRDDCLPSSAASPPPPYEHERDRIEKAQGWRKWVLLCRFYFLEFVFGK